MTKTKGEVWTKYEQLLMLEEDIVVDRLIL